MIALADPSVMHVNTQGSLTKIGYILPSKGFASKICLHRQSIPIRHVNLTYVLGLELWEDVVEVVQELDKVLRSLYINLNPSSTADYLPDRAREGTHWSE